MSTELSRLLLFLAVLCGPFSSHYATAFSLQYYYRGNNFNEFDGIRGLFTPTDHVTARFTLDCSEAHSEGNCKNLPYDDYLEAGAIDLASVDFSAGAVVLPTPKWAVEVMHFPFSTDHLGSIVDWDMDLFLAESGHNATLAGTDNGYNSRVYNVCDIKTSALARYPTLGMSAIEEVLTDRKPDRSLNLCLELNLYSKDSSEQRLGDHILSVH